ncbi:hypothetical protein GN316_06850 [Xylophilus sp. Kf1]|nr:hypothetical protein [Xylophilus sp. Kf1]
MNYKLFSERAANGGADLFIATLTNVTITPASWKMGIGRARIPVPGWLQANCDEDLANELAAEQPYFLAGSDGERFDFELAQADKAIVKSGNSFRIAIL